MADCLWDRGGGGMNNDLMFSSKNMAWDTRWDFFNDLNRIYHFTTDVCATENSTKCEYFLTPEIDALRHGWNGICYMNPPYGRETGIWVKKAYHESMKADTTVIALLPARTDTRFFHDWIYNKPGVKTTFIKGRLTFGSDEYWQWVWQQEFLNGKNNSLFGKFGKMNPAPFPSMIVEFNPII